MNRNPGTGGAPNAVCPRGLAMRSIVSLAAAFIVAAVHPGFAADDSLLIHADKIYPAPGAQPLSNGSVLVRSGRISSVADEHARIAIPTGTQTSDCRGVLEELRTFRAAGGQVLFGTDVGYMHAYDTAREFELMAKAGMSADDILESLTTAPAARWKDARLGRVAPGYQADLVVLGGDPAEDVKNFANVRCVFRAGKLIYASSRSP